MIDFDTVREKSRGRWVSILRSLGVAIREDGKHGPCPFCGGKDRMRFDDKNGAGTYYCSQCGAGDGFSLIMKVLGVDIKEAMKAVAGVVGDCEKNSIPKEKRITPEQLRSMFDGGSRATEGDLVGKYLNSRGLSVVPPDSLWYSPNCWEAETKQNQQAMLGVFQMPDGKAVCIHRTYLTKYAEKMAINSPKKITPALVGNISGGAVRLFPAEGDTLGIAEGVETAIAAHEDMGMPVWASLTSVLLEKFEPPANVKRVVIVADNDANYTGQKAAYTLANRLVVRNKIDVSVYVPLSPGDDWLDVLNKQNELMGTSEVQ